MKKPARKLLLVIPGRAEGADLESITRSVIMDSGFARHSALKTRVNALKARAPE